MHSHTEENTYICVGRGGNEGGGERERRRRRMSMAVSQNMHQDLSLMSFITLKKTSSICRLRRKDDTGGRRRQKHQGLTVIRTPSDFT